MKKLAKHLIPNIGTLILVSFLFLAQSVGALPSPAPAELLAGPQAPSQTLVSYQGTLTDSSGDPINATVTMEFALYDTATGGNRLWGPETQSVQVSEGAFHVLLGSVEAINPADLTGNAYLELEIDGETLTPRELLTSVAHAVEASTLSEGDITVQGSVLLNDPGNNAEFTINPSTAGPGVDPMFRIQSAETGGGNSASTIISRNAYFQTSDDTYQRDDTDSASSRILFDHDGRIYFSDADAGVGAIDWENNLVIKPNGKVGVGITSPGTSFSVKGALRGSYDVEQTEYVDIGHGGVNGYINTVGDGNLDFRHDGDTLMSLQPDGDLEVEGRIGVGTSSSWHQQVKIASNAVPLAFEETDESGAGSLWRMPLDAGRLRFDVSDNGSDFSSFKTALSMYPDGSIGCGALTEANLQTPEEHAAGGSNRFEEGDVLCWGIDRLEKCAMENDRLVQAVADKGGRPIVIGAESVKVLGPVKRGDILVASDVPGYAMVNNDPISGSVIAQALEDFDGEQGIIKAMIRKF